MWWTGEQGWFDWHSRIGYSLLVVTLTRLMWGFVGSYHARNQLQTETGGKEKEEAEGRKRY